MAHVCNVCGKQMIPVDNIHLKSFLIKGWRCECGNEHSNPDDVDNIVRFYKKQS